jgi:hypothetical protein
MIDLSFKEYINNDVDRYPFYSSSDTPENGAWKEQGSLDGICPVSGNTSHRDGTIRRELYKDYFNSNEGRLPWE